MLLHTFRERISKEYLQKRKWKNIHSTFLLTWFIYNMKGVASKGNTELVAMQCYDSLAICLKNELKFMN